MDIKEKKEEKVDPTPKEEVSIKLTPEVLEKIDESATKLAEKVIEKQKKFAFHGSQEDKAIMDKATSAKEAVTFVKAVVEGDHNVARAFSNERAKQLNWSEREKTITIGGDAGSDFLVPTVFENEILATFDTYDEIIKDADVKSFNKPGHIFNLNELSTRVVAFYADEDSTGLTSTQPTYTEPQIAIDDLIGAVDMTLDFLEDTEVNIMTDLSRQYGEAFSQLIQPRLIDGDVTVSGVVTKGIINSANLNEILLDITTGGYSTVSANDVEETYFSAINIDHFQQENKSGKWYMNALALLKLRGNIRSAATTNDIISVFDVAQMTLLGRPIVLTNQMPTPATTVSDPFILYGNLRNHLKIRRKRGLTMKINDQGTSKSGRNLNYQLGRELVVSQRIGHQVVLAEGLTVLAT